MNKKFSIQIDKEHGWKYINVDFDDDKYKILEYILLSDDWTVSALQEVIDGVQKAKDTSQRYEWANEDVHMLATAQSIYLFNILKKRATNSIDTVTGPDLQLSHTEFIDFMKDFQKFIKENEQ